MKPLQSQTYALFRIVAGFLFAFHGTQKLLSFPIATEAPPPEFEFVVAIAGPIELIGGILIAIGLATRPVAFLCSGLMASAYWMAHGTSAPLPIENGGELAALYCFAFLMLAFNGAGTWSIDAARGKKQKRR